jgi:hypothetical protein
LFISLPERVAEELTRVAEGPAVIWAPEGARIAAWLIADNAPAVSAPVKQEMDVTVAVPRHDDFLGTDVLPDVVVRLRHLAQMSDKDPRGVPNPGQLFGEDLLIGVQGPVDSLALDEFLIRSPDG